MGPLLFNIFVNDFFDSVDCDLVMYADDSTCIISAQSPEELKCKSEAILNQIKLYLNNNKLYLNIKKTVYMIFNKNISFTLKYDNINLVQVNEFKLLGLTLDTQFLFKKQTTNIVNKINLTNNILNKNFNFNKIPLKIKKIIFNSLICSHIHYSSIFLSCLNKKSLDSIINKFNKILKRFLGYNNKNLDVNSMIYEDIFNFLNKILSNKHPQPIFNILNRHLSSRKKCYFLLYSKPKKQLTFLFNLMNICNKNHTRECSNESNSQV